MFLDVFFPTGLSSFFRSILVVLVFGAGVFGLFTGLTAGLLGGVSVRVVFLFAYGSAVNGLATSCLRRGRTGAEDKVPTDVVETLREAAVDIAVAGLPIPDGPTGFLGDEYGSADPGRGGRFLSFTALFCAAMTSLMEGLLGT